MSISLSDMFSCNILRCGWFHLEHNLANRPSALQKIETFLNCLSCKWQSLGQNWFDKILVCQTEMYTKCGIIDFKFYSNLERWFKSDTLVFIIIKCWFFLCPIVNVLKTINIWAFLRWNLVITTHITNLPQPHGWASVNCYILTTRFQ